MSGGAGGVSQSDVCGEGTGSSCAAHERGSCRGCVKGRCLVSVWGGFLQGPSAGWLHWWVWGAVWEASPAWPVWVCRGCSGQGRACPCVQRGCGCACPSACRCGVRDESKINLARKGCPEGRFAPVELSCQPCLCLGCSLCCPGCCLSREGQEKPCDEIAGMGSPASVPEARPWAGSAGSTAKAGWTEGTHSRPAFLFPEQSILCSHLEYPVARGELLFPFPRRFSPSRPPGRFGNYRKSTRLLPLVKDNGCECVRHELQGQPRQRVIV